MIGVYVPVPLLSLQIIINENQHSIRNSSSWGESIVIACEAIVKYN